MILMLRCLDLTIAKPTGNSEGDKTEHHPLQLLVSFSSPNIQAKQNRLKNIRRHCYSFVTAVVCGIAQTPLSIAYTGTVQSHLTVTNNK
jgi:hypothetical protein